MRYQAFICYKHVGSNAFAERLELALKAYAKPLWRAPIPIFRDEKYLKPGLDLPKMIKDALDQSDFLIYLASPSAASSPWVLDELDQWCSQPSRLGKLIIVLTEGTIAIEKSRKLIDWDKTDAIPGTLRQFIASIPLYVDCSSLVRPEQQTLLDPDFKKAVNAIVAAFRGVDPIEMSGQEIIQHRKNLRNRNLLTFSVVFMMLLAAVAGGVALQQSHSAALQSRISNASQLASEAEAAATAQLPQRALLLAAAAGEVTRSTGDGVTPQTEQTLRDLLGIFGGYGLSGHTGTVNQLVFVHGGSALLTIGQNGQALLWQLDGNGGATEVSELISNKGQVLDVQIVEDGQGIRLVTQSGHVFLRKDVSGRPAVSEFDLSLFNQDEACATKITPTQAFQLSNRDGVLRVWDLGVGGTPVSQKVLENVPAACTFSDNGQWLYAKRDRGTPALIRTTGDHRGLKIPLNPSPKDSTLVAFSPQSRQLTVAMKDGRIRFWHLDATSDAVNYLFEISGNDHESVVLGYGRSGCILAVAGEIRSVSLWRVDGNTPKFLGRSTVPFQFYRGMEGQLSFERNDSLLIASDGLRAAAAIPLSTRPSVLHAQLLHNHPSRDDVSGDRATPYAVSPQDPILVTAGDDHNAIVWTMGGNTLARRTEPLRGHDSDILALAFSPDGKWLATGGYDRIVRLWPVHPPQWVATPAQLSSAANDFLLNDAVPNPGGGVQFARFISGEQWIESYGDGASVRLARINKWGALTEALALSSDDQLNSVDERVADQLRLHSDSAVLQRGLLEQLHKQGSLAPPAEEVIFDVERGRHAMAEAVTDGVRVWDLQRLPAKSTVYRGLLGPVTSLSISTRFGALAAVNQSGQIAVWSMGAPQAPRFVKMLRNLLQTARPLESEKGREETLDAPDDMRPPPRITFISSSRWLGVDDKYLLDVKSSNPQAWALPVGAHEVGGVADCCIMQLFPERFAFWIVGTDSDRPSRIDPPVPIPDVTAYDYDPLRKRLALGLLSGQIKVMELGDSGAVVKSANIASHDFAIKSIALSSDGRIVAAGSSTGITMSELSDDLTVSRHIRLKGHRGDVHLLRFSPNDDWLLSGGEDNSVHIYPVSSTQLLNLACVVAGRTLSEAEQSRLGQANVKGVWQQQSGH